MPIQTKLVSIGMFQLLSNEKVAYWGGKAWLHLNIPCMFETQIAG